MKKHLLLSLIALLMSYASFSTITGSLSVCAGGTSTVSGAAVGMGGVWSSSNPSIANVYFYDSVNATVSGLSAGTATITYLVGSVTATAVVTVNPAAFVDSIHGPNNVCIGSTITLSNPVPGGTWTAPYAEVSISPAGVVTGVSLGSTSVFYTVGGACPGTRSHFLVVSTSTMSGSIHGSFGISTGETSTISAFITGGSWSSGNPAVATISSAGVVSGISPGTAAISYTTSGCTGPASSIETVTVNPLTDGISGNVLFSSPFYGGVKVWLIKYDPATSMLEAVDSTIATGAGLGAYYQFAGLTTDSFRIKAKKLSSLAGTDYLPTYYNSSFYWHSANVIYHTAGTADLGKNFPLLYGHPSAGPGFISGSVLAGANKGTSGGIPVGGLAMVLVNSVSGDIIQFTRTDVAGNYSFSDLPLEVPYNIFPDSVNYLTTPQTDITLTATATGMTAGNFAFNTLSKTIIPRSSGITEQDDDNSTVSVFPNPASQMLSVNVPNILNQVCTVTIDDISGRRVYSTTEYIATPQRKDIDVSTLAPGYYIFKLSTSTINYVTIVSIQP